MVVRSIVASVMMTAALLVSVAVTVAAAARSAHDINFTAINGEPLPLSTYSGQAVLVVNTASLCGFTYQYAGLQEIWERYRDRGLVVLGVPSNDFGQQEPGSEVEIKTFCEVNFDVDFPLTSKETVSGTDAHPFFQHVAAILGESRLPRWNFHKYLIDPDGRLIDAWPSKIEPGSTAITSAIEQILPLKP